MYLFVHSPLSSIIGIKCIALAYLTCSMAMTLIMHAWPSERQSFLIIKAILGKDANKKGKRVLKWDMVNNHSNMKRI